MRIVHVERLDNGYTFESFVIEKNSKGRSVDSSAKHAYGESDMEKARLVFDVLDIIFSDRTKDVNIRIGSEYESSEIFLAGLK